MYLSKDGGWCFVPAVVRYNHVKELVMVINLKNAVPFGAVFAAHQQELRAAVEQAAAESAAKMGEAAAELYSIQAWDLLKPLKQAA